MTASHPRLAAGTPVPAAPPSERSPERLEGNPVPPSSPTPGSGGTGPQLAPGMAKLAAAMSEGELDRSVRRIAADLGLLVYHTHDSRRSEPGFPDLVCVGRRVMYRELKKENGRVTQAQKTWLAALVDAGQDACVWRPSDLLAGRIARKLAALAGLGAR